MVVLETILALVVVLGILVVVHEFGHFITAKMFGVRVETFSVGFGPRLFGVRRGETDYRVSAIPLGGYVKMTGENPDEVITGDPRELASRPRWQRFIIFVAGAALNIVLAVVVMAVFFMRTGASIELPQTPPVVRDVVEGSAAEAAGIREGDRILAVAGRDASNRTALIEEVFLSPGTTKTFLLERDGEEIEIDLEIGMDPKYRSGDPGMRLANDEPPGDENSNPVENVTGGSPAEAAGILPGDRIVAIEGLELPRRTELITKIRQSDGSAVSLGLLRDGERLDVEVVPEVTDGTVRIGVEFVHERLSVAKAFGMSVRYNVNNASLLFVTLKKLFRGDVSPRVMSGPIEIAGAARQAFQLGVDSALHMLAFISLQLGIINLLPIPVLDGGHIFILLIEGVLRRDLSTLVKERVMQVGLILLILFAGFVIYLDIDKLVRF